MVATGRVGIGILACLAWFGVTYAPTAGAHVKVLQRPQPTAGAQLQSAFIAAPDGVELELVEAATPN